MKQRKNDMTKDEALKLALEALESFKEISDFTPAIAINAIIVIKEVLAQPEQEPVAYLDEGLGAFYWAKDYKKDVGFRALYTTPPQEQRSCDKRTWVGLTDEDLHPIADEYRILFGSWVHDFARAIEAKLKEKNT